MSEQRVTAIEEKLAYQEDLIKTLDDVVYQQQRRIDRLEALCNQLSERLQVISESTGVAPDNERPPHY